ncbi:OmpH family outer membrane protein [Bdellovibrio bacteriovorus]|uniref:OmpH family outer membrane protein n=1 Tax=Bdellovibrio bacteriovorus TaxID=959 RepID=UPI0035A59189
MKNLLITGALVLAAMTAMAEAKIGFVDMQKAIKATSAGKKATAELDAQFESEKKNFEKKEAELKQMAQDLEKKKAVLSEEAFKAKQIEYQKAVMAFRDSMSKSQSEIQKKQEQLTAPILEKMEKVIAQVSKEKGFTMVLQDTRMIVYSVAEVDLTEDVVKAYEKEK